MSVYRILRNTLVGAIPLVLLTLVIAACGSSTTTTSGAATSATATATACPSVTAGTIQSVSGTSLQVKNAQGKVVQAMFTSKTTFVRSATLTAADLKTGMLVSVVVKQNADNSYSALTVSVRTSSTRSGVFTRGSGSSSCTGQRLRGTGTPGTIGGGNPGGFGGAPGGGGSGQSRQTISGTVSSVNANSLVVTDTSGNDFTVTLTTTTRISGQQTITASDLQVGEAVTITGSANSQGGITASSVAVLQGTPFRRTTPTATTGA
jgi:Domain of unknown function (DUF5666)